MSREDAENCGLLTGLSDFMETQPVQRPPEIEEVTNRFLIHPAGDILLKPLVAIRIHPNFVSLAGLLAGFGAAGFYYHYYQNPLAATAGFLLMIVWHITDGIDGRLARLTGKSSQSGKVIDGLVDYTVFILVYVFMSLAFAEQEGYWITWYGPVAGFFHIIQAATYEKRREEYIAWKYGNPPEKPMAFHGKKTPDLTMIAALMDWFYQQIQRLGGANKEMDELKARLNEADPEIQRKIREEYCARYAPILRQWSFLSANTRTIAIYMACLFASPLYYFLFEILVLNMIMLWLMIRQRHMDQRYCDWITQQF